MRLRALHTPQPRQTSTSNSNSYTDSSPYLQNGRLLFTNEFSSGYTHPNHTRRAHQTVTVTLTVARTFKQGAFSSQTISRQSVNTHPNHHARRTHQTVTVTLTVARTLKTGTFSSQTSSRQSGYAHPNHTRRVTVTVVRTFKTGAFSSQTSSRQSVNTHRTHTPTTPGELHWQ